MYAVAFIQSIQIALLKRIVRVVKMNRAVFGATIQGCARHNAPSPLMLRELRVRVAKLPSRPLSVNEVRSAHHALKILVVSGVLQKTAA